MLCGEKEVRHTFLVLVVAIVGVHATAIAGCASNCGDSGPEPVGITVVVTDAKGRVCDAVVTATEGTYAVTLWASKGDPAYCEYSTGGRVGTYDIHVSHAGYNDAVVHDVVVTSNGCGVHRADVSVQVTSK